MWIETKKSICRLFGEFPPPKVFTVDDVTGIGYNSRLIGNMGSAGLIVKIGDSPVRVNNRYIWIYQFTKHGVDTIKSWIIDNSEIEEHKEYLLKVAMIKEAGK